MATPYDFQIIERELSSLEKQFNDFEGKFRKTVAPIREAHFDSNKYNAQALEQRANKLINDMSAPFSAFVADIRQYSQNAMTEIEKSADSYRTYVKSLNDRLDSVAQLNSAYEGQRFSQAISYAEQMREHSTIAEIVRYALLVELEAYDKLCKTFTGALGIKEYAIIREYFELCEIHDAPKHICSAGMLLFTAAHKLISENGSGIAESDLYQMCIDAFNGYSKIARENKRGLSNQLQEVYQCGLALFNKMANAAYVNFDYISVKNLLHDSAYFKTKDIENEFFTNAELSPERVFAFLKEYGSRGSKSSVDAAFDDSKALAVSDEREEYFRFWFRNYDTFGWEYCGKSIDMQEDRFAANGLISKIVRESFFNIRNMPELALNLYENYNRFLTGQSRIDLDLFLDSAIELNSLVNVFAESDDAKGKHSPMHKAIRGFDGVSYGMITKYRRLCSRNNELFIEKLNIVLDDSSNRLYGKPYRMNLKRDEKKPSVERLGKKVLLVTLQSKRKALFILLAIAAVVILAGILFVLFQNGLNFKS